MNPIQSKIEQTAKEYLLYKAMVDKEEKSAEDLKKDLINSTLGLDSDERYGLIFDKTSPIAYLKGDLLKLKEKLFSQLELVKDVVDVPKEITDLVEDFTPRFTFAIIGDERKVVDKELHKTLRAEFIERSKITAKAFESV